MLYVDKNIALKERFKFKIQKRVSAFVYSISLLLGMGMSSYVSAQSTETNWAKNFVNARVAVRNFQAINTNRSGGGRSRRDAEDIQRQFNGRIVGGTQASANQNPFQVALLLRDQSNNSRAQFCGGALVTPTKVVTAAHCSDFIQANQVQVLTGTRSLSGSGRRINVRRIAIHPNFNANTLDADVAVWELASAENNMPLAQLDTSNGSVGQNLLVTGWGRLAEGGSVPTNLQAVTVPRVSTTNCNDSNSYNGGITSKMFCAGFDDGGRDACQGDSGGPITRGNRLTGVVSWGIGCARPNLYGVYTRLIETSVKSFLDSELDLDVAEDCVRFNNNNITINTSNPSSIKIVDGSHSMLAFGNKAPEAKKSFEILKHYRANKLCFVGRPKAELTYILRGDDEPSGSFNGEDCLRHNLAKLAVKQEGSRFLLTDGRSRMIMFNSRSDANNAKKIMQTRELSRRCFVGRPGPSFSYLRK